MSNDDDVRTFDYEARAKAKPPKKPTKRKPDKPFRLEKDGPVYYMRGEINGEQTSILGLLIERAGARKDDRALGEHTQKLLDLLFTGETVDALLLRLVDPDDWFDMSTFKDLMRRTVEEHSGNRPTGTSRTSSGTRRRTGVKSTVTSSSKGSTSTRSRSTAS